MVMFNLNEFIAESVTLRQASMFSSDIEENREALAAEIGGVKFASSAVPDPLAPAL